MVLSSMYNSFTNMLAPPAAPASKKLRVAVVGGGVSGLTCAIALARLGLDVQVYEGAVCSLSITH